MYVSVKKCVCGGGGLTMEREYVDRRKDTFTEEKIRLYTRRTYAQGDTYPIVYTCPC